MSDTAVLNGSQSKTTELSEEQYRALCKQLRAEQIRRGKGKKKSKPVLKPRGKVIVKQISISIEESATDLDDIEDEPFSLDSNCSQLYVKTGKERIKCVNTGKSISVGGAAVYRVFL
jgi:hypothetical protein